MKLHINPGYDSSIPYQASLEKVLEFKPHSISVSYKKLSWEIVELAHKAGVEVWVWTVDSPEIARAMAALGVDASQDRYPNGLLIETVQETQRDTIASFDPFFDPLSGSRCQSGACI